MIQKVIVAVHDDDEVEVFTSTQALEKWMDMFNLEYHKDEDNLVFAKTDTRKAHPIIIGKNCKVNTRRDF